ncbi:proteasome subunit alpha type 6 [Fusarium longipes]|uniref:Proteasome subunit alpha type 6 n=1 Tax=Fusarium longipes TaxID=694270 RepID=A0A395RQ49_9HYPO|nr:proteasome subunit alpha type 6 [Fusarium longipes]
MSGQVPAWKRLGLKLQQPSNAPEPSFGHPTGSSSTPIKRKFDAPQPSSSSQVAKRPRQDETTGQLKQKSVSFADAPSTNNVVSRFSRGAVKPAKLSKAKSKGPAKKPKPQVSADLKPALEYLRLWKTARDSWKFNKNHQSNLIKHVFDADGIPASDIEIFYDYIQDLKGFVRMRLRETACEVRDQDQSDGAKAFPEGTKDLEATQLRYEEVLAKYLQSQPVGSKRKGFAEVDFLSDSEEDEVIVQRLVKRMRAELVIDELSDSDETEASTASSQTVTTTDDNATATKKAEKSVKPVDGLPAKRRRKLRVNVEESDSSSSESDSDSDDDSDTSSSGSSSSEDESEKKAPATARSYRKPGEEDSSDSSSSDDASSDASSSDDDSDSE